MSPKAAKAELSDLFEETKQELGVTDWRYDESGAVECTTAEGHDGQQFGMRWVGPGTLEPDAAVATVSELWLRHGIETTRGTLDGGHVQHLLHARDSQRLVLEFTANEHAMILDGESVCAPVEIVSPGPDDD
ncbi:hypothetical protein [Frondihabitans cladoniiphilus]|uniref:Uncharacterized protein n=1 Tax=Frondihabitans cladoniiphilus TaxID=715785 RepID=A0ABP8W9G0_9MICO